MDANVTGIIIIISSMIGVGLALGTFVHKVTSKLDEKLTGQIGALDKKFDGRIDKLDDKLTARIDSKFDKLDRKIDKLGADLRTEIRGVRTELTARIDTVHAELIETRVHLSDRVSRLEGAVLGINTPEPVRESA